MIPRRPFMEGRAASKSSSGSHGGSRSYRKISSGGHGRGAYSHFHEKETTGGGVGGENNKPAGRPVHLSSTRRESTEVVVVVEQQKWKIEEEFLRKQFGEGEEWRRKDKGLGKPPPEPLVERIFLNDEEEDGVHGGRMKPLTSFDLNRGMPPPQNRKLRIKLSPPEDNPTPAMDGAAPKAIRRPQDKENGGLVPLCPGTTQIRGMKRKTVSPTDLRPQGGKRARAPNESGNTTDESTKGPAVEIERDGSQGMDMLLMALLADPNQRSIAPSQQMARPAAVQATTGEKAVKNGRVTQSAGATVAPLYRPQMQVLPINSVMRSLPEVSILEVQTRALREDQTASREEELKASKCKKPLKLKAILRSPQVTEKIKGKVEVRKDDGDDSSSSDEDDDLSYEEYEKKYGPPMKPHRYRPAPFKTAPFKDASGEGRAGFEDRKEKELHRSDDDVEARVKNSYKHEEVAVKLARENVKENVDVRKDDDEDSSSSDEDDDLSYEEYEKKYGPFMKPHRYRFKDAPSTDALEEIKEKVDVRKDDDEDSSSIDDDGNLSREELDRKFGPVMRPHKYRAAPFKDALDNIKEKVDVRKDDDDLSSSDEDADLSREELDRKYGPVMRPHRCRAAPFKDALDKTKGKEESSGKDEDPDSTKDSSAKNVTRGHRYCMTAQEALDVRKIKHNTKNIKEAERACNEAHVDKNARGPHQYQSTASAIDGEKETEQDFEAREREEVAPSYSDEEADECVRKPHRYRVAPSREAFGKRAKPFEGKIENKGEKSSFDVDKNETVITPHLSKVHPSQARVLWSQEHNVNQPVLKECRITGLSCSTSVENQQRQHKVSKREPTGHASRVGISLREDFDDSTIAEKSHDRNQEVDFRRLLPSAWGKYPGARQQSTRKVSSGAARTAYDQQPRSTKKKKVAGHNSAFCIVPKQVKLATASCIIDNGEPSHPSVGSVVVECLPPSTEKKGDNRAPFCESQNRDAALWSSRDSLQSANDVGIWDTDKENISWVPDTASGRPSSVRVKVPCTQDFEVITRAQNDASSLHLSRLSSVARVAGNRTLGHTSSGKSLHPVQNSRSHLAPADSKAIYSTGVHYGSSVQLLQQQQRPRITVGAGSGTCTSSEDNETRHEIAGITMQRRSWEALKSAEYFAKRRFDPKTEVTYDNNYVPVLPSRFQNAEYPIHGVSNVKPKPNFETHLWHGATLSRSIGVPAHADVAERRVTHRRGPTQGKQERLSIKVLNRNLENFVQLRDVSCPGGIALSRSNQAQNEAHFPVDVCQLQFPLRSYSGLPKVPPLKTRQRRGPKKLDKERLKSISTKTTSSARHFKPLSEPSGLLGGLNPGIIGRVRNSKQIHAILGALIGVASRKEAQEVTPYPSLPKVPQDSACVPVMPEAEVELEEKVQEILHKVENGEAQRWTKGGSLENEQLTEVQDRDLREDTLDQGQLLLSNGDQCHPLELITETHEIPPARADGLASRTDEAANADYLHEQSESLTQMLSSLSGDTENVDDDNEQDLPPMSVTDSSTAAAGLAARWLELLSLDAKGRLSALKRSRRRVQCTLSSGPLNPENRSARHMSVNAPSTRSAIDMDVHGSQQSVCSDATTIQTRQDESSLQVDRWRALFANMDVVLGNEATKLESWLWQIKQMQAYCPSSTEQPFSGPEESHIAFCQGLATSNAEIERQPPQSGWPLNIDAIQKELGFAASAASIMSTANFVTKVQNFT